MLKILGIRLPLDDLESQISSHIEINVKLSGNDKKLKIFSETRGLKVKKIMLKRFQVFEYKSISNTI